MKKSLIKEKSYSFAMVIIGLYKTLLKQNEFVLSKQLLRSGTSIGDKETALLGHGFPGLRSALDKYTEDVAVDGHRIQDEIGFRPKYDLLSGWKETIEEMRAIGYL